MSYTQHFFSPLRIEIYGVYRLGSRRILVDRRRRGVGEFSSQRGGLLSGVKNSGSGDVGAVEGDADGCLVVGLGGAVRDVEFPS